jgi:hypothetical protein
MMMMMMMMLRRRRRGRGGGGFKHPQMMVNPSFPLLLCSAR